MCRGDRLVADFVAGTDARPGVPAVLEEHLTTTADGTWVVWAHKLARQQGNLFVPLTGGPGYPADARAQCRNREIRGNHDAPDPLCTCGFHAVSNGTLPKGPGSQGFTVLTVALSGRVLAFEWAGGGVLWRAERQTVVRVDTPTPPGGTALIQETHRRPGDPDGRLAAVSPVAPRDSGPVRLRLAVSSPALPVCQDDAGWCLASSTAGQTAGSFAALLRELRLQARFTQEELAEKAGLSPRSVSDLERGVSRTAQKATACLLADALGIPIPLREAFVAAARGKGSAGDVMAALERQPLWTPRTAMACDPHADLRLALHHAKIGQLIHAVTAASGPDGAFAAIWVIGLTTPIASEATQPRPGPLNADCPPAA